MGFTCPVKEGDLPSRRAIHLPAHAPPTSTAGACNTNKIPGLSRIKSIEEIFPNLFLVQLTRAELNNFLWLIGSKSKKKTFMYRCKWKIWLYSSLEYRSSAGNWKLAGIICMCFVDRLYPAPTLVPRWWYEGRATNTKSWRKIPQYSVLLSHGSVTHWFLPRFKKNLHYTCGG
jgi:hypothetical protein